MDDDPRRTYTIREVSQLLGLSVNATYAAVREGIIPSIRIGRRILVSRAALDAWLGPADYESKPPAAIPRH